MVEDPHVGLFEEWKQARDTLKTFDDRIHDLRKYGFSFVTGLMAVEGILLPWYHPLHQLELAVYRMRQNSEH